MIEQAKGIILRQPVPRGGGAGDAAEEAGDLAWGAKQNRVSNRLIHAPVLLDGW
jgi:hypothetical protein